MLQGGEILVSSIQGDFPSGWPGAVTRLSPSGTIERTRFISHLPEAIPLPSLVTADSQRNTYWFTQNRVPLALAVDASGGSYVLSHLDEQTGGPMSSRFEIHAYSPTGWVVYSNRLPAYAEGQGTNAHHATPKMIAADPAGHVPVAGLDVFFVPLESDIHVEGRYGALLLRYSPDGRPLWKQRGMFKPPWNCRPRRLDSSACCRPQIFLS